MPEFPISRIWPGRRGRIWSYYVWLLVATWSLNAVSDAVNLGRVGVSSIRAFEKKLTRYPVGTPVNTVDTSSALPFKPVWLIIGMPTVPRDGQEYLARSVESFIRSLPVDDVDPYYGQVRLVVMNNQPKSHPTFYRLKAYIEGGGLAPHAKHHVSFVDNPGTIRDPDPTLEEPTGINVPAYPGSRARNQTAQVLEIVKMVRSKSKLFMFAEDDFIFCNNWLEATHLAIKRASALLTWGALRISFGMNGVIIRNGDLPHYLAWMWRNITMQPVDLLWEDYVNRHLATQKRPLAVYRHVLLEHIGGVSTFKGRTRRKPWPTCYQSMANVWSLAAMERFDEKNCAAVGISPCAAAAMADMRHRSAYVNYAAQNVDFSASSTPRTATGTTMGMIMRGTDQVPLTPSSHISALSQMYHEMLHTDFHIFH
eukprot:jgi/Mesvir1/922/Mv26590-RA.1